MIDEQNISDVTFQVVFCGLLPFLKYSTLNIYSKELITDFSTADACPRRFNVNQQQLAISL